MDTPQLCRFIPLLCAALQAFAVNAVFAQSNAPGASPEIRTPPPPAAPRINGPGIFGVRPGSPFFYHIPATGNRDMEFSAADLPMGLKLNAKTGDITGTLAKTGEHVVTLRAKNAK